MTDTDVVVVGSGVVGLATADAIRRRLGLDVVVIDKEAGPARHQSGHNSGVVHSGLYYAPGSAKATLVARGRRLLVERSAEWGLPIERCGKVVVATDGAQLRALEELERRGRANGVELTRVGPAELRAIEPHVSGIAALSVPGAAITDFASFAGRLAQDLADRGVVFRFDSELRTAEPSGSGLRIVTESASLDARWLVNCAGLHSDRVARIAGSDTRVSIVPFRGEYHELRPQARHLVRHLVYPVPDPRWPFLGVHLTRMIDRSVHVGPNAVLALGREAYRRGVDRRDALELARSTAVRRLAARYWRTGLGELARSRSPRLVLRDVRRLLPELTAADLVPAGAGIRAQAIGPDGRLLDDFAFARSHRAVHVLNAPSPAATASLAIGEVIAERLAGVIRDTA